jgi:hypothetical protein
MEGLYIRIPAEGYACEGRFLFGPITTLLLYAAYRLFDVLPVYRGEDCFQPFPTSCIAYENPKRKASLKAKKDEKVEDEIRALVS